MVFVGRSISENDLFAKLVDTGAFIDNVDETVMRLRYFVAQLQALKIGNVVRVKPSDGTKIGNDLDLVAVTPSAMNRTS